MVSSVSESEFELGLPSGEVAEDGEWVLAIFELGAGRRATSTAARVVLGPDGSRLVFEPRDWHKLADFVRTQADRISSIPPSSSSSSKSSGQIGSPSRDASSRAQSASAKILIVDDDPDIRDVVSTMLEAVGLVVSSVESAEDALAAVRESSFDLLVLDWNLPRMSGLDLCRIIRQEPNVSTLPVLFLTANASSQDMVEAFASGADDYVVKPFRAPELGARIFSLLRRARVALG